MKKLIALVGITAILFAGHALAQEWYSLQDNQRYVTDFSLGAGESEEISVETDEAVKIGFNTNVNYVENGFERYSELSEQYGYEVIKFSDSNAGNAVTTVSGGALVCKPVDGSVDIAVTNLTEEDFDVVIYTEE